MDKKESKLVLYFIEFVIFLIATAIWIWELSNKCTEFGLAQTSLEYVKCIAISIVPSVILFYIFIGFKRDKVTKCQNWFSMNYPKAVLYYCVSLYFLNAINKNLIFDKSMCKEVVDLNWDIFGISITVLLAWEIWFKKQLEKKQPLSPTTQSFLRQIEYIDEKRRYSAFICNLSNALIYLSIDLIVIFISTILYFLNYEKTPILVQNVALFGLSISMVTILSLFFEMLIPIYEEKREKQIENKVTLDDRKKEYEYRVKIDEAINAAEAILKTDDIYDAEKIEIVEKLFRSIGEECLGSNTEKKLGE